MNHKGKFVGDCQFTWDTSLPKAFTLLNTRLC